MARKPKEDKKAAEEGDEGKKKKKKGMLIPAVIVMVGLLGAGYMVSSKGKKPVKKSATTVALPKGPILTIDPTTINLADGHFLEVGLALQVDNAKDLTVVTNDEALALNAAIAQFSKDTMSQLTASPGKSAAQSMLTKKLSETFEKKVTVVYFTDFVMQ